MQVGSRRVPGIRRTRENISREPPAFVDDGRPRLRLALARGHLAMELECPYRLGPLSIVELVAALPNIRFPVDLSGGVGRFRHRRGELLRLVVQLSAHHLTDHAQARMRGILPGEDLRVTIAAADDAWLIGAATDVAALAFDVVLIPVGDGLRLVVDQPRGHGLHAPPAQLALQSLAALSRPFGEPIGSGLLIDEVPLRIARALMPEAGARAPTASGVRLVLGGAKDQTLQCVAELGAEDGPFVPRASRALELSKLVDAADALASSSKFDEARAAYLHSLERAPRHVELTRRVVELDVAVGGRAEGALATLVDVQPAVDAGGLGATLLLSTGDRSGACEALSRAGHVEVYGGLAAHYLLQAAQLDSESSEQLSLLDRAIARAPWLARARWERLAVAIRIADMRLVQAEADHLEALANGSEERLECNRRIGELLLERGFAADAQRRFLRGLRFAPRDAMATLGLARAFREVGKLDRACLLFSRAVDQAEKRGERMPEAELELARILATYAHDRPAAVARVGRIQPTDPQVWEARVFEAELRHELGDFAGASRALARLRTHAETLATQQADPSWLVWWKRAAQLMENELSDVAAARQTWVLIARSFPRDRIAVAEVRRLSSPLGSTSGISTEAAQAPAAKVHVAQPPEDLESSRKAQPALILESAEVEPEASAEARVEQLTDALRARPNDDDVAFELASLLEQLGRDLDLVALVSARIEEKSPRQSEFASVRRTALVRLAVAAEREGRPDEASLYREMAKED